MPRRLACWSLLCLFLAGYVPARVVSCTCSAAANCGCVCWRKPAASDAFGGSVSTRANPPQHAARSRSCACGSRTESAPPVREAEPPASHHHSWQPLDWQLTDAPRIVAPPRAWLAVDPIELCLTNGAPEPLDPPPEPLPSA